MPHLMIHDSAIPVGVGSQGPGNGPFTLSFDLSERDAVTSLKPFNSLHAHLKSKDPR